MLDELNSAIAAGKLCALGESLPTADSERQSLDSLLDRVLTDLDARALLVPDAA